MAERQEANFGSPKPSAGATPVDPKQNGRPASAKQGLHWFAECGVPPTTSPKRDSPDDGLGETLDYHLSLEEGKEGQQQQVDREERLRILKEKQNEERQRKLDELKQQALAAQKFREQKEEERRRRLEELRVRDTDRRHQVEERKRQIWEAERDRREAILRKNQEREARIESKRKNERSSIVFAFGSSTPRMLEPGDAGSIYWSTRRATSTSNVMTLSLSAAPGPLTRRSSERELEGSKKRATSAGGIERKNQGARSGDITPSRPQSSMSQHSVSSQLSSASASLRARTPRRPRPVSIAVTGVSSPGSDRSVKSPNVNAPEKPPIPKVHTTAKKSLSNKNETTPKKPTDKPKSSKSSASTTPKTTPLQSPLVECPEGNLLDEDIQPLTPVKAEVGKPAEEQPQLNKAETMDEHTAGAEKTEGTKGEVGVSGAEKESLSLPREESPPPQPQPDQSTTPAPVPAQPAEEVLDLAEADMTSSMIAKIRITTEEEAKAALAERRRLAREQAEREAEMERQRIEAERLAEEERLRKEEEDQRRMEEEQLRLLEEARRAEEIRLQQAIEEAQKREEEEKKRKEEELKQKLEKEEAERKAKEEAEKMRIEMEIRLKKEEEDRQARRKRVEAIMLRTRGKGSVTSSSTPSKDGEDGDDSSPPEEAKKSSEDDKFLESERSHSDANFTEESQVLSASTKQNGHHNGSVDSVSEMIVTNSLLELSSQESVGDILGHAGGNGKLPEAPFRAFQGTTQSQTVNDLLS